MKTNIEFTSVIEDEEYMAEVGQILYRKFLWRSVLLRPLGNVLYFMPPYIINEGEIDRVLNKIEDVLSNLEIK